MSGSCLMDGPSTGPPSTRTKGPSECIPRTFFLERRMENGKPPRAPMSMGALPWEPLGWFAFFLVSYGVQTGQRKSQMATDPFALGFGLMGIFPSLPCRCYPCPLLAEEGHWGPCSSLQLGVSVRWAGLVQGGPYYWEATGEASREKQGVCMCWGGVLS